MRDWDTDCESRLTIFVFTTAAAASLITRVSSFVDFEIYCLNTITTAQMPWRPYEPQNRAAMMITALHAGRERKRAALRRYRMFHVLLRFISQ